jgi:hypothetical protein
VEAAEAAYRKSSTAMFRGQVARRISLQSRSRSQAQELRCRASMQSERAVRHTRSTKVMDDSGDQRRRAAHSGVIYGLCLGCLRRSAGVVAATNGAAQCGSEVWFPSMSCLELEALPHTRPTATGTAGGSSKPKPKPKPKPRPSPAFRCAMPGYSDGSLKCRRIVYCT